MGKPTKSAAFERLNALGEALPQPSASQEQDTDAFAALIALGGFLCTRCRKPLTEANGYVCCEIAHCPFCGAATVGSAVTLHRGCAHLLYRNTDKYWTFEQPFLRWSHSSSERKRWDKLLQPTPPGRRLPGQKGPGYPHWTDEQKAEAYPAGMPALLEAIFTPTLRIFSAKRLHPVLLPYVRPEIKTQMRDIHGHRHDHYFSSETDSALDRVAEFMTQLEAGTQRLRALPPQKIIQVQRQARQNV